MGLPKPLINFHHFKTKITGEPFKESSTISHLTDESTEASVVLVLNQEHGE